MCHFQLIFKIKWSSLVQWVILSRRAVICSIKSSLYQRSRYLLKVILEHLFHSVIHLFRWKVLGTSRLGVRQGYPSPASKPQGSNELCLSLGLWEQSSPAILGRRGQTGWELWAGRHLLIAGRMRSSGTWGKNLDAVVAGLLGTRAKSWGVLSPPAQVQMVE